MAGCGSETEGIGFFFGGLPALYMKGKMRKEPPIHQLKDGHTRVEEEFGAC